MICALYYLFRWDASSSPCVEPDFVGLHAGDAGRGHRTPVRRERWVKMGVVIMDFLVKNSGACIFRKGELNYHSLGSSC
jgi:hypothetical protein